MIGTLIILLVFLAVPCLGAETNHTTQTIDQTQQWWKPKTRERQYEELNIKDFVPARRFAADNHSPTPTHDQIKAWWKPEQRKEEAKAFWGIEIDPHEDMGIGDAVPVRLKSGEQAFVASVSFPTRGRCCDQGLLLVRPTLHEARQTHTLSRVDEIIDLDQTGIDEVVMSGGFTGQGVTEVQKVIFYFDGWEPITLHSRLYVEDDLGSGCGVEVGRRCHREEVKWTFVDVDGDGKKDLVELIECGDGDEPDALTFATKVNVYLFKDKKFVLVTGPETSEYPGTTR
jgi:hypothetical protein